MGVEVKCHMTFKTSSSWENSILLLVCVRQRYVPTGGVAEEARHLALPQGS